MINKQPTSSAIDPYGFADLEGDPNDAKPRAAEEKKKFPCEHCAGTGLWRRGVNSHGESKCFACSGRGHFMSSADDRSKARAKRRESKARKLAEAQVAFMEHEPDLITPLTDMADWNEFARSLIAQFGQRGSLSSGQVNAARNMIAKTAQTKAERQAERDSEATAVDLTPIRTMFEAAIASGLKRPTYRAEGLIISRAPDHGRNAGALYIKLVDVDEDVAYQGKITPDEMYRPAHGAAAETPASLQAIATSPEEAAVRYGRHTGRCGCCGRELTKEASIQRGIGPVCATKFGF